jgi:outer membrane protein TolC
MASGRALSGLLVPALAQTVFDAGRRRAICESARANCDAAVATYRQASLTAFQQVDDNVAPLRIFENESHQQRRLLLQPRIHYNFSRIATKAGSVPTCRL